jgi:hypothetical protein
MVIGEVNDSAQGLTVVEVILHVRIPREACDAHLNPRESAN